MRLNFYKQLIYKDLIKKPWLIHLVISRLKINLLLLLLQIKNTLCIFVAVTITANHGTSSIRQ